MKKVTSIRDKIFLGSYLQDQEDQPKFDGIFFLGVASTVLVPQIIFCFFFGSGFALVFLACALSGGVLGKNYRRFTSPLIELRLGTVAQDRAKSDIRFPEAA